MLWDLIMSIMGGLIAELVVRYTSDESGKDGVKIPSPGEILKVNRNRDYDPLTGPPSEQKETETFGMVAWDLVLHVICVFVLYESFMLPMRVTAHSIDQIRGIGWMLPDLEVQRIGGWLLVVVLPLYFYLLQGTEKLAQSVGGWMNRMVDFSWMKYRAVASLNYLFFCFGITVLVGYWFAEMSLFGAFFTVGGLLFFMSGFLATLTVE